MPPLRRVSATSFLLGATLLSFFLMSVSPAQADEAHERALEARVRALELDVQRLEAHLNGSSAAPTPAAHLSARSATAAPKRVRIEAAAADPAAPGSHEQPSHAGETPTTTPPAASPAATTPSVEAPKPDSSPQETFVFRDNSVTLRPLHLEASTEFGYVHGDGFLQTDRVFTSTSAVRLGLLDWLEFNATVPAFTATRTRGTGPFRTQSQEVGGLGDVLLQVNARVHEQTENTPGVVISLGTLLPTGPAPYDFSRYQPNPAASAYNPNPTNLNAAYFSRGAWGAVANLQLYKTLDPVILFAGVGARYLLPQSVQGHTVQAGVIYTYNIGLSLALSEKSTLGFQVAGEYENKLVVDQHAVPQTNLEPVVVRVSLIQRIFAQTWLEPALTAGLTNSAPGLGLSVGLRRRF